MKEITVLNRIIRWQTKADDGGEALVYEPDPRHVEILMAQCGPKPTSNPVVCPGIKAKSSLLEGPELAADLTTPFRSACMRLAYLVMDGP